MRLDRLAIEATAEAMRINGCSSVWQLRKLLKRTYRSAEDQALLRMDADDWTVKELRHWLRLLTDYQSPDSRWIDEQ